MLDAIRRATTSWLLKGLLLLLVLAFVMWGVADVFTGFRTGALANACGASVSVDEYQRTYGLVMDNLARRFGQRPSAEQARARGLDRAILNDLINQTCLDQHGRSLGLALPNKTLIANIQKDPSFAGQDGNFSQQRLNGVLRDIGYSERGYLAMRRQSELREQLSQSMFQNLPVPLTLTSSVHAWRDEARTLQYFTIDQAKLPAIAAPDEAKLKQTYETRKDNFMAPEYRHLGVLLITTADAKKRLTISEADLRKAYDGDKTARVVPERRHVWQIAFKDKAAAEAAAKSIAGGKSFLDIAKDSGATEKDADLGVLTRAQLIDPAIAEAAFALEKDNVSAPVSGRFATVLLRVTEISPGRTRPFDEMKQQIRDTLANAGVNAEIRKMLDAVDDGRAAGKTLKEIAGEIKAHYVDIAETSRVGLKADGSKAYDGIEPAKVLSAGFTGQVGVEGEALDLADGGYGWVDVIDIKPSKLRPFDVVKADVEKLWRELERQSQLDALTKTLIERAGKGETLATLATETGGKLMTSKAIKRLEQNPGVPASVAQRAFAQALGAVAASPTDDRSSRVVFRLVKIDKPDPPTKEQVEQINETMREAMQKDLVQVYVGALRSERGVSINEALFRRTTGASETP